MKNQIKNIILLIVLSITYIPLLSFTWSTFFLGGISYSCLLTDPTCFFKRPYDLFLTIELILLNLVLIIFIIETLSALSLFNLPKISIMNGHKKNIVVQMLLWITYIPLFLGTLLTIGFSGIDDSCKFLDLTGVSAISHTPCISRTGDIIFAIDLILLNLVFFITIIINIKNLTQNKNKKGE